VLEYAWSVLITLGLVVAATLLSEFVFHSLGPLSRLSQTDCLSLERVSRASCPS
ncbi:hypothetical protein JMJ77_0007965, partial [Colletotrichum scovillei]